MATDAGNSRQYRATHGKWVVADSVPDNPLGLLSVGSENFGGESLRSHLDRMGATVLGKAAKKVRETGVPIDTTVSWESGTVRVKVEPILAPISGVVVGILGIVTDPGAPLPPRPEVGVVEWQIEAETKALLEQSWDAGMFALYENAQPAGSIAQWMNQSISPRGRDVFEGAIRDGMNIRDTRFLVKYFVFPAGDRNREKQLEFSGWTADDPDETSFFWLRGLAREAQTGTPIIRPVTDTLTGDLYQRAAGLAAEDSIFLRIDTLTWDLYFPVDNWATHGLIRPASPALEDIMSPVSFRELKAGTNVGGEGVLDPAWMLGSDGTWRPFRLRWIRLTNTGPGEQFIMAHLRPM